LKNVIDGSSSTQCPNCDGTKIYVMDSRKSKIMGFDSIRRRKMCVDCKERWTTQEVDVLVFNIWLSERKSATRLKSAVSTLFTANNTSQAETVGQGR